MRQFGILLHISSLPTPYGIGDLGPSAYDFAKSLRAAGASAWQFLPVHPTATFIGNSPYSSPSVFAGNPLFISPDLLVKEGYLSRADVECAQRYLAEKEDNPSQVDFDACTAHKTALLCAAYERNSHKLAHDAGFIRFCNDNHSWLHEYARFVSLKAAHGGVSWVDWPKNLRLRDAVALAEWDVNAAAAMIREKFIQYLFFSQWQLLREVCREEKITLISDVPIYVTHDSADVWVNARLFHLDDKGQPVTVAGVPPDYFSETGQRWGNPVYRWNTMRSDGYAWWKARLAHELALSDIVRLDHFRGFCGYWEIPAHEATAVNGCWVPGPGTAFFLELQQHFGALPFIAEDLGVITEDVVETLQCCSLPGMHVLQFAFGGEDFAHNSAVPHRHTRRSVVYTGGHDNAPTRHWFNTAEAKEKENLFLYTGHHIHEWNVTQILTRLAMGSVADTAIIPMQDALNLGGEGRMNIPGTATGNWTWRMTHEQAQSSAMPELAKIAAIYGRIVRDDVGKPIVRDDVGKPLEAKDF